MFSQGAQLTFTLPDEVEITDKHLLAVFNAPPSAEAQTKIDEISASSIGAEHWLRSLRIA